MQSSPPSPPQKPVLDYFDFQVPSKKRTGLRSRRGQAQLQTLPEPVELRQENSEFEGGGSSHLKLSNMRGFESESLIQSTAAAGMEKKLAEKRFYMQTPKAEPKTNNESTDVDETTKKVWNLRSKQGKSKADEPKSSNIQQNDACPRDKGKKIAEKEKKPMQLPTFRLELTPEEIEEDLYAMMGKKVTRKPKRRPKNVQKNINLLTLGKALQQITPKKYEVDEN